MQEATQQLTRRETQVLRLVAHGQTIEQTAAALGISVERATGIGVRMVGKYGIEALVSAAADGDDCQRGAGATEIGRLAVRSTEGRHMLEQENEALIRRVYEQIIGQKNLDLVEELYAANVVWHGPGGQEARGTDGMRELLKTYLTAFPDLQITIDDLIASGDQIVVRWTGRGTHEGELQGVAPTRKSVELAGTNIARIEDGKIAEEWGNFDQLGMMQQIGAIPVLAGA